MTADIDAFFEGYAESKQLFNALYKIMTAIGPTLLRVAKSQIAFQHRKAFAWVWIPERLLRRKAAQLVLTVGFSYQHPPPRWKQIVEPKPGRFTHHVELYSVSDIDDEVAGWLQSAWTSAA